MIPNSTNLIVSDVRELEAEELALVGATALGSITPSVTTLRTSHHNIAMLLAQGRSNNEVAQITGYSPSRISILKNQDPAFQELLAHYQSRREMVMVDVLERMKILGLSSLEELQRQLDENPEGWTKRELMELAELGLVKGRVGAGAAAGGGSAQGSGVTLNIQFVEPAAAQAPVITLDPG